jgi:undecaprenyl pyrophosphate phosphatase UppP
MVQIYFLLVFLNITAGLVLARSGLKRSLGIWDSWFLPFENKLIRGLLGVATFITGFLGLIFVLPGDQIFLGDLFPSVTAMLGGTLLVLEFYRKEETEDKPKIEDFLVSNKIIIGVVCLTFGILHFFSPTVVFL